MKKFLLLLLWQTGVLLAAAQVTLTGTVTNEAGQPLPGANVVLEGTYYGMPTAANGTFQFRHLKPGRYTLAVSFIGFEEQRSSLKIDRDHHLTVTLKPMVVYTEEVTVMAFSARQNTPMTWSAVTDEKLQERNMGQDIPYLLALTPSFVATSDAGTGIGYTSFRVRGTDLNRINITLNGIPLNDAESHSTFFVDQPDLAASARNIQVQRGAGTSVNGSAAFGATVNIQTLALHEKPYAEYQAAAGSFNTFRNSMAAGTGLINNSFTFDARVSGISSDGFIDRAASDLKSLYLSAGYHTENSVLKLIAFTGWEETYQAWNGVPSVRLRNDPEGMKLYGEHGLYSDKQTLEMIASDNRTYNLYTYGNQVDHYQQDNYQLHFSQRISSLINLNAALHYTYGRGYYEQYEENEKFSDYGLPNPVINGQEIKRTNLVRRKWLDNDFLGTIFSLNYVKEKTDFSLGGSWNIYDGRHFGRLVWGQNLGDAEPGYEWYRGTGVKRDFNTYGKINYALSSSLNLYADLQFRSIHYEIDGTDDDLRQLDQQHRYNFLNPKAGLFWRLTSAQNLYLSYAMTNREPNRDNFVDTPPGEALPKHETMHDFELGWGFKSARFTSGINLYGMFYKDQLALTGQINDVGAPIMINVDKSYRTGIEFTWGIRLLPQVRMEGNATLSRNKILDFTEYVDDWNTWEQQSFYLGKTDLAFSPELSGNNQLIWEPGKFSFNLISGYVGKQYIDNTSSEERVLDPYLVNSLKAGYAIQSRTFRKVQVHLMVNNLLNAKYETNAWVYSYLYTEGKRFKMDGYFPQAGTNFMVGVDFSF